MTTDNPVLVDVANGVMTITLNRPEAKNAVNRAVAEGVADAINQLDSDDSINVGILTGAGGTFCAGMDLKAFVSGELPMVNGRGFAGLVESPPKKPLIAAVEGFALAGGLELMLASDLAVVSEDAKFGIPEVKRGLAAAAGGLMRLPRQIPYRMAMEMALTGDFFTAEQVSQAGLVNRVVTAGSALDEAKKLAAVVSANGPLAVRISKQVLVESKDWSDEEMWDKQNQICQPIFTSQDAIEGSRAFAEKRAPKWTGK